MAKLAKYPRPNGKIDSIEASLKSDIVASNINRVAILHLLRSCPKKEMQAEKMSQILGISHRTVLYHLDVLEDYELVKVSGFRKKGQKMLRSVWGLNLENGQAERLFRNIERKFPPEEIRKLIKSGRYAR
ncbi:MAG TPA: helix-turn-helix domain-containing protein [archaeon]|jgi:DNA-binding transcriptional ArsR family regulator|nr:helix-turn-helix domain-containing protein [archaeon]